MRGRVVTGSRKRRVMITVFDIYSVVLLLVSLGMFVKRYMEDEPPILPYFLIACTCAIGSWLGETLSPFAGMALLISASFLFLGCVLYPHTRKMGQGERRGKEEAEPAPTGEPVPAE